MGKINQELINEMGNLHSDVENIQKRVNELRKKYELPFLPTDRNILNLPGVGKSMTYSTIGITSDGRRILEFEHDHNRKHSLVVNEQDKVIIIESKSVAAYLKQMEVMGENPDDYSSIWGYSMSETEERMPVFKYSELNYKVTDSYKNFQFPEK